jgi:uncharacterized protein YbdZ (MbtH family)
MSARPIRIHGEEYIRVRDRLARLRHDHPEARVETELVELDRENHFALFRARIEIPSGAVATGWGSETSDDFQDYIEKAETKALGRALAALGYGSDVHGNGSSDETSQVEAVLSHMSDRARAYLEHLCSTQQIDVRDLMIAHQVRSTSEASNLITFLRAASRPVRSGDEVLGQLAELADRYGLRVQELEDELRQHRGFDGDWAKLRLGDLLWVQARAVALERERGRGS